MNSKMKIWGRTLEIKIQFDVYEGEKILDSQEKVLKLFQDESNDILASDDQIKKYCISNNKDEIGDSVDNIFKYVVPNTIYIPRDNENKIVLLCDYRFDLEHGLAIVFQNNKLIDICPQEDVL